MTINDTASGVACRYDNAGLSVTYGPTQCAHASNHWCYYKLYIQVKVNGAANTEVHKKDAQARRGHHAMDNSASVFRQTSRMSDLPTNRF